MNKTKNSIAGLVVVGIITFLIYTTWILMKPVPVEIQGEVEATQIKVASKLTGRVDSIRAKKGMDIRKGDVLFQIISPEVEAKMSQAAAARSAAEAQQTKANNGARNEDIQAAYSVYQKAKAASEFAQKTFTRIKILYADGVVTEQKRDEVETKMLAAMQNEKAAKSVWQKAKRGARNEDKAAAAALVNRAQGVIQEVESYLSERMIVAPIDGEISNILAEEGELIPGGFPVVSIVNLDDVWVTFNLREDYLSKIKKGTEFDAKFPALGMKVVRLKVSYINALASFANWNATKTSGDFDMKTFEIHARPVTKVKGLRPGMSALVDWNQFDN